MFIEHKSVRLAMLVVLLAAVNLSGILAGWLLSRGEITGVIMSELVAVLAAGFVLGESRPRTRYYWPPRARRSTKLPVELPVTDESHPCYKLMAATYDLIQDVTKANVAKVKRLLAECKERSPDDMMISSTESLLHLIESPPDETIELWDNNGGDDEA